MFIVYKLSPGMMHHIPRETYCTSIITKNYEQHQIISCSQEVDTLSIAVELHRF